MLGASTRFTEADEDKRDAALVERSRIAMPLCAGTPGDTTRSADTLPGKRKLSNTQ
nr:hypothetical protein [uncultured Roseateles sp.]